jgi:hypothetical protein
VRKAYLEMEKTKISKIKDSKDGIVNEKRRFFYMIKKSFLINEFRLKKTSFRCSKSKFKRFFTFTNDFYIEILQAFSKSSVLFNVKRNFQINKI